jgi:hypothetical protein
VIARVRGKVPRRPPDNLRTEHAGSSNRPHYFSGAWERSYPAATVQWKAKWGPRFKHPYQIFPAVTPNIDYVGVEMIPCGDGFGVPMRPGLRFTKPQHETAAALAREMGERHSWPPGWQRGSRFVGHEDVDPLSRSDSGGGWDPGFLRASPYFDFAMVRAAV